PASLSSGLDLDRRIEPDAQHRSLRHFDFLAFGRSGNTTTADDRAENRALDAAKNAAEHGADARTRGDLAGFTLDALALDRLSHRASNRIGAAVDGHLIEAHRHLGGSVGPRRRVHGGDDAAQHRAGRDYRSPVDVQIDE